MTEIFRRIKNNNYTVMCNHHLQNEHLSLKAMGLMSKLLSLPDDWNFSVRGIAAICKDGYESVRTAFLELEKEGYIVRRRIRDQRGHIVRTEYYILETPDTEIPEEYLTEKQKKTLPESAKMEASEQEEMTDNHEKAKKNSVNLPGSDFPTLDKKAEENSPGSDFPTTANPTEDAPGLEFPTTENRHQQNTIITKYNKYNISSSSKINNTRLASAILAEEEEEIKKRIGYTELLAAGYDTELLNEILKLLGEYGIRGKSRTPYVYIGQSQISASQIAERLRRINREQVLDILNRMQNGPEIRNLRNYLLTALYQADLTSKVNKQRKEHGYISSTNRNAFNNFHQRDYDYEKLEQVFLRNSANEKDTKGISGELSDAKKTEAF